MNIYSNVEGNFLSKTYEVVRQDVADEHEYSYQGYFIRKKGEIAPVLWKTGVLISNNQEAKTLKTFFPYTISITWDTAAIGDPKMFAIDAPNGMAWVIDNVIYDDIKAAEEYPFSAGWTVPAGKYGSSVFCIDTAGDVTTVEPVVGNQTYTSWSEAWDAAKAVADSLKTSTTKCPIAIFVVENDSAGDWTAGTDNIDGVADVNWNILPLYSMVWTTGQTNLDSITGNGVPTTTSTYNGNLISAAFMRFFVFGANSSAAATGVTFRTSYDISYNHLK